MQERKIGPPCNDRHFQKIGMENIDAVFNEFRKLENYNKQTASLQKLIDPIPLKRRCVKSEEGFKCAQTFLYNTQ